MPQEEKDYELIKKWLKTGDQQKIADELEVPADIVSKVLRGVRTDNEGILLRASEMALNRKKIHEATQQNINALAS